MHHYFSIIFYWRLCFSTPAIIQMDKRTKFIRREHPKPGAYNTINIVHTYEYSSIHLVRNVPTVK